MEHRALLGLFPTAGLGRGGLPSRVPRLPRAWETLRGSLPTGRFQITVPDIQIGHCLPLWAAAGKKRHSFRAHVCGPSSPQTFELPQIRHECAYIAPVTRSAAMTCCTEGCRVGRGHPGGSFSARPHVASPICVGGVWRASGPYLRGRRRERQNWCNLVCWEESCVRGP